MADDLALTQEAARYIGEMMETEGWRHFSQKLEWRLSVERARMEAGGYADLGEYKLHAGIAQGIKYALGVHERMLDEAQKLRDQKNASR